MKNLVSFLKKKIVDNNFLTVSMELGKFVYPGDFQVTGSVTYTYNGDWYRRTREAEGSEELGSLEIEDLVEIMKKNKDLVSGQYEAIENIKRVIMLKKGNFDDKAMEYYQELYKNGEVDREIGEVVEVK